LPNGDAAGPRQHPACKRPQERAQRVRQSGARAIQCRRGLSATQVPRGPSEPYPPTHV